MTPSGQDVGTAWFKSQVPGPITAKREALARDEQSDRRVHGGPDQAICIYPGEHYPRWQHALGRAPPGAFSENPTKRGPDERAVDVADRFRMGSGPGGRPASCRFA